MSRRGASLGLWIALGVSGLGILATCAGAVLLVRGAAERAREPAVPTLAEITDPDLKFTLHRPGPTWQLLDREHARGLNALAAAAALDVGTGMGLCVIVERALGADAAAAVEALRSVHASEGRELAVPVPSTLAGREALSMRGTTLIGGVERTIHVEVLVDRAHLYQLMIWWPSSSPPSDEVLRRVRASLELDPGEVVDPPLHPPAPDVVGPLFRVEGGVLESAAAGLRVREGDGFTVIAGDPLSEVDPSAEVALARADSDFYLSVRSVALPDDVGAARAGTRESAAIGAGTSIEELGEPSPERVAGALVPFERYVLPGPPSSHQALGLYVGEGRAWEIAAWSGSPLEAHLAAALARLEPISEAERVALERAVSSASDEGVAADRAWRAGIFRDYTLALSWERPGPCWRGELVAPELAADEGVLAVSCPRLGVFGALYVGEELLPAEADAPIAHHREAEWALFEIEPEDAPAARVVALDGGASAIESEGEYDGAAMRVAYVLRSMVIDGRSVWWAVWWRAAAGEPARVEARAAIDRLTRGVPPREVSEPGLFEDRRLGLGWGDGSIDVTFADGDPPRDPVRSRTVVGVIGRDSITLVVSRTDTAQQAEVALEILPAQVLAEHHALLSASEVSEGTLAGEPCRVIRWSAGGRRYTMRALVHGRALYAVLTSAGLFGGEREAWARGLRFVDP